MSKLTRGIIFIVVLAVCFLVIDIGGRHSPESQDLYIAELQRQLDVAVAWASLDSASVSSEFDSSPSTTPNYRPVPHAISLPLLAATETPTPPVPPSETLTPGTMPAATPTATTQEATTIDASRASSGDSLFDALMMPFAQEALRRRAELAKSDPEYSKRVDKAVNEGRINFLLFGYGESHEPPETEKAIIGSQTIISYDLRARKADIISLTHDIRAPEIERETVKRGYKTPPVRIDQAYNVGGFKLMRQTLENATGLSIDFQITFKDTVMQGLVDGVFGGLEVDVPMAFDVHAFYLDGKKYDAGHFARGMQRLNGRQVIQFIKTVPISDGTYQKSLEHNVRKSLVFTALLDSLSKQYQDRLFWLKGSAFVVGELISGSVAYDFDPVPLIVNNIGTTTANIQRSVNQTHSGGMGLPKIDKSRYIVDPAAGDGGVQWVTANAAINPITKKDLEAGVYPSPDLEVPITANPYGDLATEYWPSVRELVKSTLLNVQ